MTTTPDSTALVQCNLKSDINQATLSVKAGSRVVAKGKCSDLKDCESLLRPRNNKADLLCSVASCSKGLQGLLLTVNLAGLGFYLVSV